MPPRDCQKCGGIFLSGCRRLLLYLDSIAIPHFHLHLLGGWTERPKLRDLA